MPTLKKRRMGIGVVILILAFSVVPPAAHAGASEKEASQTDIQTEARELIDALKSYTVQQKDEVVDKTSAALEKLDRRIEDLEDRMAGEWDGMTQAGRENARETLKSLRRQRVELAEWYGSLKSDTGNAWQKIKKGFSDAYSSLSSGIKEAQEEYKTGD